MTTSIKILLRQGSVHQTCGSLPFSHGNRQDDLELLMTLANSCTDSSLKISSSKSERYPDPEASSEFVIDLPQSSNLETVSARLKEALKQPSIRESLHQRRGQNLDGGKTTYSASV